jgi:hypothetical protein
MKTKIIILSIFVFVFIFLITNIFAQKPEIKDKAIYNEKKSWLLSKCPFKNN